MRQFTFEVTCRWTGVTASRVGQRPTYIAIPVNARQRRPDAPERLCAPLTRPTTLLAAKTMQIMVLGHRSGATRLNNGAMTDLPTLAASLIANFWTIRFPSEDRPTPASRSQPVWFQLAKARLAERRAANAYRDRVRRELVAHGYQRFLHYLERDPLEGWRLHILAVDADALLLLDRIADGQIGPGDPADFDPEEFVRERLGDWVERGIVRPD